MHTLRVNDILKDKVLVSRESARLLEHPLIVIMMSEELPENASGATPVTIDFIGVEGIAPSFVDELLAIFDSVVGTETNGRGRCLIVANPPTRLSSKFEAIARGHGMSVRALPDGLWRLTDTQST